MIRLTKLDGSEMFLNPDLIEYLESVPETHIALSNGNKYLILEPVPVVIDRIINYKARIMRRGVAEEPRKYLRKRWAESYRPYCRLPE